MMMTMKKMTNYEGDDLDDIAVEIEDIIID